MSELWILLICVSTCKTERHYLCDQTLSRKDTKIVVYRTMPQDAACSSHYPIWARCVVWGSFI